MIRKFEKIVEKYGSKKEMAKTLRRSKSGQVRSGKLRKSEEIIEK